MKNVITLLALTVSLTALSTAANAEKVLNENQYKEIHKSITILNKRLVALEDGKVPDLSMYDLKEDTIDRIDALKAKVAALEKKIANISVSSSSLPAPAPSSVKDNSGEIKEVNAEVGSLKTQVKDVAAQLNKLNVEIKAVADKSNASGNDASGIKSALDVLNSKSAELDAAITQLNEKVQKAEISAENAEKAVTDAKSELASRINSVETTLNDTTAVELNKKLTYAVYGLGALVVIMFIIILLNRKSLNSLNAKILNVDSEATNKMNAIEGKIVSLKKRLESVEEKNRQLGGLSNDDDLDAALTAKGL